MLVTAEWLVGFWLCFCFQVAFGVSGLELGLSVFSVCADFGLGFVAWCVFELALVLLFTDWRLICVLNCLSALLLCFGFAWVFCGCAYCLFCLFTLWCLACQGFGCLLLLLVLWDGLFVVICLNLVECRACLMLFLLFGFKRVCLFVFLLRGVFWLLLILRLGFGCLLSFSCLVIFVVCLFW